MLSIRNIMWATYVTANFLVATLKKVKKQMKIILIIYVI